MILLHEYHNVRVYDKIYDQQECEEIISFYEKESKKVDTIEKETRPIKYSNIDESWEPIYSSFLKPKIQSLIHRFNQDNYPNVSYKLKWKCLDLALLHYKKGDFCKCHYDGAQIRTHKETGNLYSAHATMIIFLDQGSNGTDGALWFPSYGYHVSREKGNAVIFPTSYTHPHEVKPCETERYVIAGWLFNMGA